MTDVIPEYKPEVSIAFHKNVRFHPHLSFGEKIFYAEIQSMEKNTKKKNCPYSSRKLSEFFGVSHTTILNWIRNLTELDLIEVGIDFTNRECRHFLKTKSIF